MDFALPYAGIIQVRYGGFYLTRRWLIFRTPSVRSDTNMKKVGRVTVFLSKIDVNFADLNRGQLAKTQGEVAPHAQRAARCRRRPIWQVWVSGYENADSKIYLPAFLAALSAASISLLF